MLSNKDIAIRENVLKECTVKTFLKRQVVEDTCHIWQGHKSKNKYGYFSVYSKELGTRTSVKAHRFAYAMAYGFDKLPVGITGQQLEDLVINHTCHNRACVNPDHLEVITDLENKNTKNRKPKNG